MWGFFTPLDVGLSTASIRWTSSTELDGIRNTDLAGVDSIRFLGAFRAYLEDVV